MSTGKRVSVERTSRTWPYIGLVLGGSLSIACNVAHAYVLPGDPAVGAVALSVAWPVLVLVAVELLVRTVWPTGWAWSTLRIGGCGLVAIVAALVSYRHLSGLLGSYHEDKLVVMLGPVAVDVLMVMATAALVAAARVDADASTLTVVKSDPATVETASTVVGGAVTDPRVPTPSNDMDIPTVDLSVEATPTTGEVASPGRPSTPTTPATPSMTSTLDERVCAVRVLVAAGDLPPAPSAEAIRRAVGGSTAIARRVRDVVADDVVQVPGQLAALDAELAALAGMAGHELARLEVVR